MRGNRTFPPSKIRDATESEVMHAEAAKPRSCFLHVPKSAGTALTLYLRDVLGRRNVFHIGEDRYQNVPLDGLMKRYPVITGHFNVGRIPDRLFDTTFFFTFLREPTDRIVSMYHFFKEGDLDSDRRAVINEEWSLEHALDKWVRPGCCSPWSNEQTFLFSGATDAGQPPEKLLPRAMRNLERFDFVGVHERFADGVEALGKLRGWPLNAPVPRFKTSRKRLAVGEMEPALVERIRAANHCDLALYARAQELWEDARARAHYRPPVTPTENPLGIISPTGSLLPRTERGSREVTFNTVDIFDGRTGGDAVIQQGNPAEIRLAIYSNLDAADIHVGVKICDQADLEVYSVSTRLQGRELSLHAGAVTRVTFAFDMTLATGGYFLNVVLQGGDGHDDRVFHAIDNVMIFWCLDSRPPAFSGLVDLQARMTVARPVFTDKRWHPPKFVRRLRPVVLDAAERTRAATRETTIRSWHRIKGPLLRVRPPKFVRYLVRTFQSEGLGAFRYLLSGRVPPKRDGGG